MTAIEFALGVVAFVVILLASIALHELGHFVFARRFQVPVRQFMVGFGPTLWSRRVRGTEFGVKLLPLGGYISMKGMYPDADDPEEYPSIPEEPAFWKLRALKKITIMAAGPAVNLVLAVGLMLGAFWGMGATAITAGKIAECTPSTSSQECSAANAPSPASAAVHKGDVIVAIDGHKIAQWDQAVEIIRSHPDQVTTFTLLRDGRQFEQEITLASIDSDGIEVGYLGVTPGVTLIPQSLADASGQALATIGTTVTTLVKLPVSAVTTVTGLFTGTAVPDRPVSLVGVGQVAGTISSSEQLSGDLKLQALLLLGAQLNLALFLINMVPLPPFDGGHIAVSVYQSVRDRIASSRGKAVSPPVSVARLIPVTLATFATLAAISLVFIVADIFAPVL
ncbi:MAG TPA: site-2 protease family protein [Plantibacter sp.]|uniref:M50 family metallopeptidase n=1 Tax=unclassified Plantibacter TaxID=2624265 RepID=UPI002C08FF49|nr:site-2 protease family protein [Plantibacter sp.]